MFGDQAAQLGDRFGGAAEFDPGPQPLFGDREPQFRQPGDGRAPTVVVGESFQDLPAPQPFGLIQQVECGFGVPAAECGLRAGGEFAEPDVVDLLRARLEDVPGRPAADPFPQCGVAIGEAFAERVDVGADVR